METNTPLLNEKIAQNLTYYRKKAGLTQAELAERINYSDKSVSKWESANGVPDVYVLTTLARLYGVTVSELIGEGQEKPKRQSETGLHVLVMALSVGIVWLVATCLFVLMRFIKPEFAWMFFVYAIPVSAIVTLVFACVWRYRMLNFLSVSLIVWGAITAIFLTLFLLTGNGDFWMLYLLGVPLQILEILWASFRYSLFGVKRKKAKTTPDEKTEEIKK